MKKLIFLTYNADKNSLTTVDNMASLVGVNHSIINIPHQNLTPEIKDSIIITLGTIPNRYAKQYIEEHKIGKTRLIQLPTLNQLQKNSNNVEHRKQAQQILESLRDELKNNKPEITEIKVKEEDIRGITVEQVLLASEKLQDTTFHHTQNGELIEIGPEKLKSSGPAVFITYQELLVIKRIQEVLKTTDITIKRRS